jgi:hypothetical protein
MPDTFSVVLFLRSCMRLRASYLFSFIDILAQVKYMIVLQSCRYCRRSSAVYHSPILAQVIYLWLCHKVTGRRTWKGWLLMQSWFESFHYDSTFPACGYGLATIVFFHRHFGASQLLKIVLQSYRYCRRSWAVYHSTILAQVIYLWLCHKVTGRRTWKGWLLMQSLFESSFYCDSTFPAFGYGLPVDNCFLS